MTGLALAALGLALLPAFMIVRNLKLYLPPPARAAGRHAVSVLIPARNEEQAIEAAVRSALADDTVELEVIVLDDGSADRTATIVEAIAAEDPRIRLEPAPPLPCGWSGKQHACWVLAGLARHRLLVFVDADVRLAPAALGRMAAFLEGRPAGLASGVPRQVTGSLAEALVIPLIHFLLLGFLPIGVMRRLALEALGAGCGQLMIARAEDYRRAGGHAAISASLHDGITLPRAFRAAGIMTDLFDATGVASCRMYCGFREMWQGFAKNATEGMAKPLALPLWTVLLGLGQIVPPALLLIGLVLRAGPLALGASGAALAISLTLRLVLARRFEQSRAGALLHPLGVALVLAIQWQALWRACSGKPRHWRDRAYPAP